MRRARGNCPDPALFEMPLNIGSRWPCLSSVNPGMTWPSGPSTHCPPGSGGDQVESMGMSDEVIELYLKDIDLSLLRENLKLTPEQRLVNLMNLQKFAEELQRARQSRG